MKTLSAPALAALAQPCVPLTALIQLDLSSTVYLNTSGWNLVWAGHTYTGAGAVGRVDAMEDAPGEIKGLRFELSGVPSSMLALALAEPVQGRPVTVSTAIFDPATYQVLDVSADWVGRLDVMSIVESGETATVVVTAEHRGVDLLRAAVVRYTNADQQRFFAGDRGLEYVVDQVDQPIVWPSREYFRQ
jgi:hypothetical protein